MDYDWSYAPALATIQCGADNYVAFAKGGWLLSYGGRTVDLHQGLIITFKLAFIDSWDGETFRLDIDDKTVFSAAWNYRDSTSNTCQSASWNDAYATVKLGLNHTSNTINFRFTSTLDQTIDDEAWGICDLNVTATSSQVRANGERIQKLDSNPLVYFPCKANTISNNWKYNQGYKTITCATGDTYLAYGQGGVATSNTFALGTHSTVTVYFKLAFIDSWDGETFSVTADGKTIFSTASNFRQATSNSCQSGSWNDAYTTVNVSFGHTAPSLTFVISSTLDQTSDDEAWGVCDFTVKAT
eukprot:CAMPEP_0176437730 /NCGR_PEP_ID=MMETSP0127-20121128/18818_1 /TAXON_ID=938130 /ORGANISM="Platyophrya macrostoma, Strain WH" /LENGTH=298 /DNA_ID=CAMNT_0017821457 /DNA_START=188 /DNA_END=1084 /DNA_ORIENTATION=+